MFPEIVVPQNGWFIRENPIKMDDLGVPLFGNTHIVASETLGGQGIAWGAEVSRSLQ